MRKASAVALVAALALIAPQARSVEIGEKNNGLSYCDEHFTNAYAKMQAINVNPGRDLIKTGASDSEVCDRAAGLRKAYRELNAPEPAATPVSSPTPAPAPASTVTGDSGGCPASMAPESGSAGYSAYNPSSGATGCYQVIPSTAAAYGCDLSTPGGQDECAARICAGQGNSAWAASGAAPC